MKKLLTVLISFLFTSTIQAQIFTTSPNQLCAENVNLSFNLTASGLPASSSPTYGFYEVCVTLNHPMSSDVRLELESPSGTFVWLAYNNGGAANFTNACFRLYASNSIRYSNAPFSNAYMAYDNMRDLTNYQNPNGVWKLHYIDNMVNGVTGTLQSWSINFISNPHLTSINNATSNLPIFKIDVPGAFIPDDPKIAGTLKIINNASSINNFNATSFTSQHNIAIERQGYTSSGGDKPNYDFEIQNAVGVDTSIALLGMPAESDWILKSCYTDEYMMKDPLTFDMSRKMGYYAPRTRFVEMIVNGDYAGLYILEEKLKRDSNRINIAKLTLTDTSGDALTGGYIFEINPNGDPAAWYSNHLGYQYQTLTSTYEYKVVYPRQSLLLPQQLNYIHSFVDSFEDALQGPNYQDPNIGWRKYASEKDLIDFLIVSEYSTNYDTYGRSTYLYKEKNTDGNKIHCGPPWDADRGYCCDTGWVHILTHGYWVFPFWWQKLRTDSVFNKRLACRFANLRNEVLTDVAFLNAIDSNQNLIQHAVQRNVNRWQNYVSNISNLKTTVINRLAWMQSNLSGNVFPPLPLTNTTFCAGDSISIFINNQYTYNFQPGPDTSFFVPMVAGNYKAVVSTKYGCEIKQNILVTPHPQPIIAGNQYPCKNSSETYSVTSIPGTSYVWTVNGGTPIIGCGANDATCTVLWGNPTFCMVSVQQALSANCQGSDIHPITIQICTSVNNIDDKNTVFVFPSPASNILYIQSDHSILSSIIYDATGRTILKTDHNTTTIDVSALESGCYIIKLRDLYNKEYVAKFSKE